MQSIKKRILFSSVLAPLWVLFVFSWHPGLAQNKAPIEWSRFDLLADSSWAYQGGIAMPEYFSLQFDDRHWQKVDAEFLQSLSMDTSEWSGIGVFRKKFSVPDSLRGKRAELMLRHFGASEIYLDGKLICPFGKVGHNATEEVTFVPQDPVQLDLDDQSSHLLVIYYSNHVKHSTLFRVGPMGFAIKLSPLNSPYEYTKHPFRHWMISMCIIICFCLFFGFVYAFYPYRLASLIGTIYIANFSLIFVGGTVRNLSHDVYSYVFGQNIWQIAFTSHYVWALLFMYSLYYNRMPKRALLPAGLMIIGISLIFFSNSLWLKIIAPLQLLLQLEAWRIIILGLRNKRTGFWILAVGWFLSILGVLFPIFDVFNVFPQYLTTTQTVLAVASDMLIPLTLALQLAWEFGSANRDLRRQLVSVNDLSRKNLEQEHEKQQILSTQNETLEKQVAARTSEVVAQNKEIEQQRDQVTNTLEELRATQKQLIQSEKMASLGELTAGIAHEIQNPLNFVNNFSEVNTELIDELKRELAVGSRQLAEELIDDIKANEEKIIHHGKRADAIVKGMLQHSRTSSGVKEPTDINALCDEYLRLSYHGLRAKDKSFNSKFETHFDPSLPKLNVIPSDIGRVILNLINNAFYAVAEKKKEAGEGYEPLVTVSTKKINDRIEISVKDNGNGIPQKVLDKIFQPFFTTKPTGQGTGLGLSLSYDIVKAHGGELKVETKEGESLQAGSMFVVILVV